MAPPVQGLAAYKKKDGTLSITADQKSIQWLPLKTAGAESAVNIAVADITSGFLEISVIRKF
jgi:transcription initiation factor TFIIH subunit 1